MRREREKQIFRETQGARISRWIRDSEAGWLFHGPRGKAYHILAGEGARLEAEGNATAAENGSIEASIQAARRIIIKMISPRETGCPRPRKRASKLQRAHPHQSRTARPCGSLPMVN